jgi:hypothetical protein
MEENSLTLAILREIRDNTARTNERVDHLTERVDHLTERVDGQSELLQTMAAVQIRQEQALIKLTEIVERHDESLKGIHGELRRIHDRIDNVFEGPLSTTVRDHESRLRRLEGRDS